jgi:hypothetical protein
MKSKYETEKFSWLIFGMKKLAEFEEYFDIITVWLAGSFEYGYWLGIDEYLNSYTWYEKKWVENILDNKSWIRLMSFWVDSYEKLLEELEECVDWDTPSFDDWYCNALERARKEFDEGSTSAKLWFSWFSKYYIKNLTQSLIIDTAIDNVVSNYSLSKNDSEMLKSINIYLEITSSNYKTF